MGPRGKKKRDIRPADSSEEDDEGAHKRPIGGPLVPDSSDEEQTGLAALANSPQAAQRAPAQCSRSSQVAVTLEQAEPVEELVEEVVEQVAEEAAGEVVGEAVPPAPSDIAVGALGEA